MVVVYFAKLRLSSRKRPHITTKLVLTGSSRLGERDPGGEAWVPNHRISGEGRPVGVHPIRLRRLYCALHNRIGSEYRDRFSTGQGPGTDRSIAVDDRLAVEPAAAAIELGGERLGYAVVERDVTEGVPRPVFVPLAVLRIDVRGSVDPRLADAGLRPLSSHRCRPPFRLGLTDGFARAREELDPDELSSSHLRSLTSRVTSVPLYRNDQVSPISGQSRSLNSTFPRNTHSVQGSVATAVLAPAVATPSPSIVVPVARSTERRLRVLAGSSIRLPSVSCGSIFDRPTSSPRGRAETPASTILLCRGYSGLTWRDGAQLPEAEQR